MAKKQFKGLARDFINAMKTQFIGKGADPNDIFVQDLFNYEPPNKGIVNRLMKNGIGNITNLSMQDREILDTIIKVYNENITTKKELLTQSRQLFETDIVQTVIDVMIDDGFNSFNNEKEEFRIEYRLDEEDKELIGESFESQVQNIIDEFVEKHELKARVAELIPELLRDGEYAWGCLYKDGEGVTEIVDDMDVINLLPFYIGNKLCFVMRHETYADNTSLKNNTSLIPPKIYKPDNMIFFRLKGPTKKRINLSSFYDSDFRKEFYERTGVRLPKYVRIPVPIYYSAIKNLNRLQLMENVSTVLDLSEVLKPEVVMVTVPTNTNAAEAQQIIRDYERQLNDNGALADTDSLDVTTLATHATRRKVLPQWMDTKGALSSSGMTSEPKSTNAWNSINNLRNLVALSIGIPPFYINILEGNPLEKAQIIKLYSRYTRKLTSLQKTLAEGIKDILCLHCEKLNINISRENINIKFKSITSGDSLDDTDMMVATVTGINDLYKGIEEITSSDSNNLVIDDQQFKQLFDNLTSRYLNISDLIKISDDKFNKDEYNDEEGFTPDSDFDGNFDRDFDNDFNSETGNEPSDNTQSSGGDDAYQDFVNTVDDIELEEPQTITTEG